MSKGKLVLQLDQFVAEDVGIRKAGKITQTEKEVLIIDNDGNESMGKKMVELQNPIEFSFACTLSWTEYQKRFDKDLDMEVDSKVVRTLTIDTFMTKDKETSKRSALECRQLLIDLANAKKTDLQIPVNEMSRTKGKCSLSCDQFIERFKPMLKLSRTGTSSSEKAA